MAVRAAEVSRLNTLLKRFAMVCGGLCLSLVLCGLFVANSQDGSVKLLQAFLYQTVWDYEPNSFKPRSEPRERVFDGGLLLKSDIAYGDKYPNSYLDIWLPNADLSTSHPTVIYMHGGGWFMGDKATGDPLAGDNKSGAEGLMAALASEGLAVVNLNYALAPEYRYPVQITQLNDAIQFLRERAEAFGLDMSNLVIMGGSAGAHMTAQYGLLASSENYAARVGINPAVSADEIKALVIYSAPLKLAARDWRFNTMMWSYLGTKDLESSKQVKQTDIVSHLTSRYPATYITDGNQPDTFPEHAIAMASALRAHNVDHMFNYYEPSVALLGHGYTGALETEQGQDNLNKTIAFIKSRVGL